MGIAFLPCIGEIAVSKITDNLIFDFIKQHYRPYDLHEAFGEGFLAYQAGNLRNPHEADSIWGAGCNAVSKSDRLSRLRLI